MPRSFPPLLRTTVWTLISVTLAAMAVELSLKIFPPSHSLTVVAAHLFAFAFTVLHGLEQYRHQPLAALGLLCLSGGTFGLITLAFQFTLLPVLIALGLLIIGLGLILSQLEQPAPVPTEVKRDQ